MKMTSRKLLQQNLKIQMLFTMKSFKNYYYHYYLAMTFAYRPLGYSQMPMKKQYFNSFIWDSSFGLNINNSAYWIL